MKLPRWGSKRGWWKATAPAPDRLTTYTATVETPGTATTISVTAGQPLTQTVTALQNLDDLGVVEHHADDLGVVRWQKAEPNQWDLRPPF